MIEFFEFIVSDKFLVHKDSKTNPKFGFHKWD